MTISNFDRFRLEHAQQQALSKGQTLEATSARASQVERELRPQSKTNNRLAPPSHYRDPKRLAEGREYFEQERQDRTMKVRPGRPVQAAPPGARASSMTRHQPQLPTIKQEQPQQQAQVQQEVWTSTEDLFWDHMREVQNKWNTLKLNDDIWAKLIYFEQNRRLAKAYVSTPVLTVDGSINGLDGFRIGLSGIENSYRDLDSMACLRSIGQGIKLKIDSQGNILIRKLAPSQGQQQVGSQQQQQRPHHHQECSIWVKEWPVCSPSSPSGNSSRAHQPATSSSSSSGASDYSQLSSGSSSAPGLGASNNQENWHMYELLDSKTSYKLFDMQKFRAQLEASQREHQSFAPSGRPKRSSADPNCGFQQTTAIDWRQCVSIISFVRSSSMQMGSSSSSAKRSDAALGGDAKKLNPRANQDQILSDPCWLMLINIIAIDMLKSSACDSPTAARPSPSSQTSALVNRYQREAQDFLRAEALEEGAHPNGGGGPNYSKLASGKKALSASGGALPPPRPSSYAAWDRLQPQQQPRGARNQLAASSLGLATQAGSERLRRLNNIRHQQQASLSSSGANSSRPITSSSSTSSRLQARAEQHYGSGLLAGQQRFHRSSHQLDGSIYTTFTGKYLDKQQRQRLSSSSGQNVAAMRERDQYQRGQLPHQQPHYVTSSIDDLRPSRAHFANHTKRSPSASSNYPDQQHLLYHVDPFTMLQRQGGLNYQGRLGAQQQQRDSLGRLLPLAGTNLRRPPPGHMGKQLSHSLSAFDLSHGLKLNLRSMNSTSIKMNFDSDEEAENVDDDDDQGDDFQFHIRGSGNLYKKLTSPGKGNNNKLAHKSSGNKLAVLDDDEDQEAVGWKSSPNKQSADKSDDSQLSQDSTGGEKQAVKSSKLEKAPPPVVGGGNSPDAAGDPSTTKLPQNAASRSSIAESSTSTASSSSGCADNDYFISQSSNSSMSCSSRSAEGEDLFSQPASSSGIACGSGSGNTSDECERNGKHNSDCSLENSQQAREPFKVKAVVQKQNGEAKTASDQKKALTTNGNKQQAHKQKPKSQLTASRKQNISLNRCYNVKTVDFSDNELESTGNETCGKRHAGFGQCHLHHGIEPAPTQEVADDQMHQCDCGELDCSGPFEPLELHPDDAAPCDCCCDCFYQPSPPASPVRTPTGLQARLMALVPMVKWRPKT